MCGIIVSQLGLMFQLFGGNKRLGWRREAGEKLPHQEILNLGESEKFQINSTKIRQFLLEAVTSRAICTRELTEIICLSLKIVRPLRLCMRG